MSNYGLIILLGIDRVFCSSKDEQRFSNLQNCRTVWISYYLQYIISSKDCESLEKKVQSRNSIFKAHNLLTWHRIKNRHDPGMEITAQTPKHFQKSLSVTTVYSAVLEYRLICSIKQKRRYKIRNVAVFSLSKLTESRNEARKHGLNTRKVEKLFRGQTNQKEHFWKCGRHILWTKEEFKSISDGMGCISVFGIGNLHNWKSNICSNPHDVFFSRGLAYFGKTMLNCILHLFRKQSRVVCVLKWPAVQTFH